MFRIQKDLAHIEKSLGVDRDPSIDNLTPSMVVDDIRAVVDTHGWPTLTDHGAVDETSPANAQSVSSTPVPEGEAHYVYAFHGFHNNAVTPQILRLDIQDAQAGITVGVMTAVSVVNDQVIAAPRPFLIGQGQSLRLSDRLVVGVGSTLRIQALFVRLKPGQYIPGSPYG